MDHWIHLVPVLLSYYKIFKADLYQIVIIAVACFAWVYCKPWVDRWWRNYHGLVAYTVNEYDEQPAFNPNFKYVNRYLIYHPEYAKRVQSKVNTSMCSFKIPVNGLEHYCWEELGFCSMQIGFKGSQLRIEKRFYKTVGKHNSRTDHGGIPCNQFHIQAKSFAIIDEFIRECQHFTLGWIRQKETTGKIIYNFVAKNWVHRSINVDKTFDNLILDPTVKAMLTQSLTAFQSKSFQDFNDRFGMANKIGFLFYGPPGCGKTSTILAISNMTKLPIYSLHPSQYETDTTLQRVSGSGIVERYRKARTDTNDQRRKRGRAQRTQSIENHVGILGWLQIIGRVDCNYDGQFPGTARQSAHSPGPH